MYVLPEQTVCLRNEIRRYVKNYLGNFQVKFSVMKKIQDYDTNYIGETCHFVTRPPIYFSWSIGTFRNWYLIKLPIIICIIFLVFKYHGLLAVIEVRVLPLVLFMNWVVFLPFRDTEWISNPVWLTRPITVLF